MDAARANPPGDRQRSVRRWLGLLLLGLVAGVWLFAFAFVELGCGDDCGDSGGRGVFALAVLVSPCCVVGGRLIVSSAVSDVRDGQIPGSGWRLVVAMIRLGLIAGGLAAVLLTAGLVFLAVAELVGVSPASGGSDPALAGVYALLGGLCAGIGWAARDGYRRVDLVLCEWA